jgi:hypothetical protein
MKIGPHNVRIISDRNTDKRLHSDGEYGNSDPQHLVINIRSDLPDSVWHETLLHEVLHHIWALTPLSSRYTSEQEEEVIRALSPYLYSIVGKLVTR